MTRLFIIVLAMIAALVSTTAKAEQAEPIYFYTAVAPAQQAHVQSKAAMPAVIMVMFQSNKGTIDGAVLQWESKNPPYVLSCAQKEWETKEKMVRYMCAVYGVMPEQGAKR